MTATDRPLVTFFLFGYNQERFVRESVNAVFAQTYSPLEIILSDDCSRDGTFDILREMAAAYRGPHKVRLNRNDSNLGIAGHVNRAMELARGELFVGTASDDVSLPHRTETIWRAWEASGRRACSIHSAYTIMDEEGKDCGLQNNPPPGTSADELRRTWWHFDFDRVAARAAGPPEDLVRFWWRATSWVMGGTQAWHHRLFDHFGPLRKEVIHEDRVLPFRSSLLGTIEYIPEPLVRYRRHPGNISGTSWMNVQVYREMQVNFARRRLQESLQWEADLQRAPAAPRGCDYLIALERARYEYELTLHATSFQDRWRGFRRALRAGLSRRFVFRNFAKCAFPPLYNRWIERGPVRQGTRWEQALRGPGAAAAK